MNPKLLSMLADYGRAIAVAILTLIASGNFDPRSMVIAAAASLLPLLQLGMSSRSDKYGRGSR